MFFTREIFAFTTVIVAASDGISHSVALNVMFLLKVSIICEKVRILKIFTVIGILKVIVPTFAKAMFVLDSMLEIAMDMETLTLILAGILSHVL